MTPQEEFNELSFYTLAHPDTVYFIHQHIVDAFLSQTATENTKSIGLTFSLVGLYLFLEKGYTGRQIQQAHMKLAQNKKAWPKLELPNQRGTITVSDVLKSEAGPARDRMIKWSISVWTAYKSWHLYIATIVNTELGVG